MFREWELAKNEFNIGDYELVYEGDAENNENVLDKLFEKFNLDWPVGFHGHSLSVSDIIALNDGTEKKFYYCDMFGWKMINDHI
jgi:hypothetical protein